MTKNILLFGAPGAGKGTQAERLIEKYGFHHISTGEVIRQEIASGSPLGRSMDEYISRGELAPDELVIEMVADYIEHHTEGPGNIFDGFPRTVVQARELDNIMGRHGLKVDAMISLEVPEDMLVERLLRRGKTSGRKDDTNEETIRNRIGIYERMTKPVAEHYAMRGLHLPVDGTGTVDEIFDRICDILPG